MIAVIPPFLLSSSSLALGAIVGFVFFRFRAKHEYNLRLWEKIVDPRIQAHRDLISIAMEARVMIPTDGNDGDGEMRRSPQVMIDSVLFQDWSTRAIAAALGGSTWQCIAAKREAAFLQDYLGTLFMHLRGLPDSSYREVGVIVREDFIQLSSRLEKAAFSFFEVDLLKLEAGDLKSWHKYPMDVTLERLNATKLMTNFDAIEALKSASSQTG